MSLSQHYHSTAPFPVVGLEDEGGEDPQLEFELEFYDRLLDRQPEHREALRGQAELLARRGRYEEALQLDRRLLRILPDDSSVHYNLACRLAVLGRPEQAIASLRRAIRLGFGDFRHLTRDSDLDSLRYHSGYRKLLRSHGLVA